MTKLVDIGLLSERRQLPADAAVENMSRVVCALLVRGLRRRLSTTGFWKVSIHINESDLRVMGKVIGGVLMVAREFPVSEFVQWPLEKRQSYMLEFVSTTLREVLREHDLDASLVDDAIQYVVQQEFRNVIVGKKRFRNPDTGEVAHIECVQEMDDARIYVVIGTNSRTKRRVMVASTVPDEFIIDGFFGTVAWPSSGGPVLLRIDGSTIDIPLEIH
jgi:hypothetical protein